MTEQEQKVMDRLMEFWNELTHLRAVHADEFNIYRFHFHAIQAQLISRGYIIEQLDKSPQGHLPGQRRQFTNINTSDDVTMPVRISIKSDMTNITV